jgi:hypothetical protein
MKTLTLVFSLFALLVSAGAEAKLWTCSGAGSGYVHGRYYRHYSIPGAFDYKRTQAAAKSSTQARCRRYGFTCTQFSCFSVNEGGGGGGDGGSYESPSERPTNQAEENARRAEERRRREDQLREWCKANPADRDC